MDGPVRRTPDTPQGRQAQIAALGARIRTLSAQLKAAVNERDLLTLEVERLQAEAAAETWRRQ